MSNLEIIDRLCAVTQAQSDIIREQATFIEEQLTVDAEIKKQFAEKRKAVDDELDLIEYGMRPYRNTLSDAEGHKNAIAGKEDG